MSQPADNEVLHKEIDLIRDASLIKSEYEANEQKMANDKFRNKYRIASARAAWWDYSTNAAYFVTMCTANRKHYFGEIENTGMWLSKTGEIANALWHEITNHFNCVTLGSFVVMPNHIHGIIIIDKPNESNMVAGAVETRHALSLPPPPPPPQQPCRQSPSQNRFQNQGKNTLSSIVGSYKSAVTNRVHKTGLDFAWQSRFHDHIIRNDNEYQRIANYIGKNIINWQMDKLYGEKI